MVAQVNRQRVGELEILADIGSEFGRILTDDASGFVSSLVTRYCGRRDELLALRKQRQAQRDAGAKPDFLPETKHIREGDWKVTSAPEDLTDRRVEITGPVDRKMIINALNSGAKVYMADFEDAHSPTWEGTIQGQINLFDAVEDDIEYTSPEGKHYTLGENLATLVVRPRGWHLPEKHVLYQGVPIPGALLDFLKGMSRGWNISLFHYRNHGAAYGRVLLGMQLDASDTKAFRSYMDKAGYDYTEETENLAYQLFAKGG